MAENSKIEWTDHTFNPWIGCTKVGPGCDHCYAENQDKHRKWTPAGWGAGQPRKRTSVAYWNNPLKWNRDAERKGVRYRVFCASLADVFDNEVPDHWRTDLFSLIEATPNLDWLLLTKRISNAERMIPWRDKPWPNVWLGATVVNQEEADRDIPKLLATRAAIRFLSIEPLLEAIVIEECLNLCGCGDCDYCSDVTTLPPPDWVIVGGESGPNARPMHPQWVASLRDQCKASGTPFLFKQWGEWAPAPVGLPCNAAKKLYIFHDGKTQRGYTEGGQRLARYGKAKAGRLFDGVEHNGFPAS